MGLCEEPSLDDRDSLSGFIRTVRERGGRILFDLRSVVILGLDWFCNFCNCSDGMLAFFGIFLSECGISVSIPETRALFKTFLMLRFSSMTSLKFRGLGKSDFVFSFGSDFFLISLSSG